MRAILLLLGTIHLPVMIFSQECPDPPPREIVETEDFFFEVESGSGAVGDVVGVTVYLRSILPLTAHGIGMVELDLCHDPRVAVLVGEPSFSDELVSLSGFFIYFFPVSESAGIENHKGDGFNLFFALQQDVYTSIFSRSERLALMTVYYRIIGSPGNVMDLVLCDRALARGDARCLFNHIHTNSDQELIDFVPLLNKSGTLAVLEGPATHPDRPPEPIRAKVYPVAPTAAQADFRVEVGSITTFPGAKRVAIEIKARAAVEYTTIVVPIDFDERYLRLFEATSHLRGGVVVLDNRDERPGLPLDTREGLAVLHVGSGSGGIRIAEEREEVHLATLYFDVIEVPPEAETALRVTQVSPGSERVIHNPVIGVRHEGGAEPEAGLLAYVEPASVQDGVFRIEDRVVRVGDANLDDEVNLSDAIFVLNILFLGLRAPLCLEAADFTGDRAVDLSDAVSVLNHLFLGGPGANPETARCTQGL